MWPFVKRDPQRFISRKFEKILKNAVVHLSDSPRHPFRDLGEIYGNGVYAIYHDGPYHLYDWVAIDNSSPIYIGKAVPRGWRSSRVGNPDSFNLYKRLSDHRNSISQAENLSVANFSYKYVILNPDLIASVEAEAIRAFSPMWNSAIEGFGNHNVGRNRLGQEKSEWDVLHPGRPWADQMNGPDSDEVEERIRRKLGWCDEED